MWRSGWLAICLLCCAVNAAEDVRTWTDVDGRKMQAQFVREVDGDATFLKDGKLIIVPLDRFREEDQKLIRELEAGKKVEETMPPAGAPRPELTSPVIDPETKPGKETKPSLANKRGGPETRTWRDVRGKQTSAKFVRVHEGNVILSRGARTVTMPFATLSRETE